MTEDELEALDDELRERGRHHKRRQPKRTAAKRAPAQKASPFRVIEGGYCQ